MLLLIKIDFKPKKNFFSKKITKNDSASSYVRPRPMASPDAWLRVR